MNMIVGKKQLVLASLVVALGVAVYLNYQFAGEDLDLVTAKCAADHPGAFHRGGRAGKLW